MDRQRRKSFSILLTSPFSTLSEANFRVCLFAASASNVDAEQPVHVLVWFADTGRSIIWC